MGEHGQSDVGIPRPPGAGLVVVESGFVFCLLEAFLSEPLLVLLKL